ncbi:uncharacterized protein LOC115999599 [Ipomoea triloba]|uniref:uncharacterized protein LOC115999599 n=1 Tax=Ipomoea triloba TaxID=35885 RepID=UPI00125E9545|nr:uncharacterized protein LOC115999599 [Ipomoea triloba]
MSGSSTMMRLSMESERSVKVIVVEDDYDSDPTCVHMLRKLNFQVEVVKHPKDAFDTLVRTRGEFDVVISDVNMPDINRFQQMIAQQFGLPVLLICDEKQEGTFGQKMQNFLRKPVSAYELKDLWQIITAHQKNCKLSIGMELAETGPIICDNNHKSKFNWTTERHFKFMDAIQILGGLENKNAVPNKILRVMNEPGLTREHVSSHLQKYRKFKISGSKRMNKLARNDKVYHTQQSQQDVSSSYSSHHASSKGCHLGLSSFEQDEQMQNLTVSFFAKNENENLRVEGGKQQSLVSPVLENNIIYQETTVQMQIANNYAYDDNTARQDNSYGIGYHWIDFANDDFYNQLTINQCLPNQQQVNGDTSFGWPQHQTFQENFNQGSSGHSCLLVKCLCFSVCVFNVTTFLLISCGAVLVNERNVPDGAEQTFVISQNVPDTLKEDLAWGSYVLLRNTNTISVLISTQDALCVRGYWTTPQDVSKADVCDWFEKQIQKLGLFNLEDTLYFPQATDSQFKELLPKGTRSLLVQPLLQSPDPSYKDTPKNEGFVLVASGNSYAYDNKDRAWIGAVAGKFRGNYIFFRFDLALSAILFGPLKRATQCLIRFKGNREESGVKAIQSEALHSSGADLVEERGYLVLDKVRSEVIQRET